jgi:hypothetical protein
VKIEFFKLTLDSRGRPGQPQRLGAPVIERRPPSFSGSMIIPVAISPDGKELAYAWPDRIFAGYLVGRGPATITVQDVATGSTRTWSIWPAPGTGIGSLSFGGDGRLAFVAFIANAAVSGGTVVPERGHQIAAFMILNLAAHGPGLVADSRLVSYDSQPFPPGIPGPWFGPTDGLISPDGRSAYLRIASLDGSSRLARMSVGTGQVTDVLVREGPNATSSPVSIDGNQMLIFLPPRHPNAPGGHTVCAILAGVNLSTGGISRLPAPSSCPGIPYAGLYEAAW